MIRKTGFEIVNIDTTICLQKPKIKNRIPEMQHILSEVMDIPRQNVSVKATTTEKLGFVGEEKGISAYAVALIQKTS